MDRFARLLVFVLGISIGVVFVLLAGESTKAPEERVVPAEVPDDQRRLGEVVRAQFERILQRERGDEREEPGRQPPGRAAEDLDDEALVARAQERARRRAEAITAAAADEATDPDWGPATERRIAERFAAKAPAGFKLLSTSCKTSLCIAEVEAPSRRASTGQSGWHRFLGASRGYIYHRGDEGGAFRTVVFLAREGRALPE